MLREVPWARGQQIANWQQGLLCIPRVGAGPVLIIEVRPIDLLVLQFGEETMRSAKRPEVDGALSVAEAAGSRSVYSSRAGKVFPLLGRKPTGDCLDFH
ncbi:hypothetical protein R1flu_026573 [Riccia fluitans]|uniref:Uncharacterized protein n=1 Tax=Riccia fluitans TaxID=41844 RepID=A0ABD1XGB0_9MARC